MRWSRQILFKNVGTASMTSKHLTHWGRETHICVCKLIIIGSDNGLSPGRRQAIIWTNAGILLIGPLGTNFNEILIEIHTFSLKKMHLKMSSAKGRLFSLGLNECITCLCEGNPPVICRFSSQKPVVLNWYGSFVVSSTKMFFEQASCRWFETSWHSCDVTLMG